jgi:tetratricopeptide (TPR) repeat protein
VYGPQSIELAPILSELAILLRTREPDEALRLYQRNYEMLVAAGGPDDGDAGVVLANIGSIHTRSRRYQEARETLTRALAMVRAGHGENDPRVAGIIGNLAVAERGLGNYRRALEYQRQDLEMSTRALGPDHPTIGTIWLNLARSTQRTGDFAAALEQIDKALAILRKHFSPRHSLVLTSGNSRATYLMLLGRVGEARAVLEGLLALEPESNEGRIARVVSLLQLSDLERQADRPGRALALVRQALDDPTTARDPKLLSDAHWARACTLAAQGARDEAERARVDASRVQEADAQATPAVRSYALAHYAACARDREGALRFLQEAVSHSFSDPIILFDPTFAAVRDLPAFAGIAAQVKGRALGE